MENSNQGGAIAFFEGGSLIKNYPGGMKPLQESQTKPRPSEHAIQQFISKFAREVKELPNASQTAFVQRVHSYPQFNPVHQAKQSCKKNLREISDFVRTLHPEALSDKALFQSLACNPGRRQEVGGFQGSLLATGGGKGARQSRMSGLVRTSCVATPKLPLEAERKIRGDKFDFTLTIVEERIVVTLIPSRAVESFSYNELIERTLELFSRFYQKNRLEEERMSKRFKEIVGFDSLNTKELIRRLFFLQGTDTLHPNLTAAHWRQEILNFCLTEHKKLQRRSTAANQQPSGGTKKLSSILETKLSLSRAGSLRNFRNRRNEVPRMISVKPRTEDEDNHTVRLFSESILFQESLKVMYFVHTQLLEWDFGERFKGISRILGIKENIAHSVDDLSHQRKNLTTFLNEIQKIQVQKLYQEFQMPARKPERPLLEFSLKNILERWNHQGHKYADFYIKNRDALAAKFNER